MRNDEELRIARSEARTAFYFAIISVELAIVVFFLREIAMAIAR